MGLKKVDPNRAAQTTQREVRLRPKKSLKVSREEKEAGRNKSKALVEALEKADSRTSSGRLNDAYIRFRKKKYEEFLGEFKLHGQKLKAGDKTVKKITARWQEENLKLASFKMPRNCEDDYEAKALAYRKLSSQSRATIEALEIILEDYGLKKSKKIKLK